MEVILVAHSTYASGGRQRLHFEGTVSRAGGLPRLPALYSQRKSETSAKQGYSEE